MTVPIEFEGSKNVGMIDCVFDGAQMFTDDDGPDYLTVLTSDIVDCLRHNRFSVALTAALTVPDICSKLEQRQLRNVKPNKIKQARYEDWFNRYVSSRYPPRGWPPAAIGTPIPEEDQPPAPGVTGADAYALRNAVVHGADFETPSHKSRPHLDGFTFFGPSENGLIHRGYNYTQRRAYLDIGIFCNDTVSGVLRWEDEVKENEEVVDRRKRLARVVRVG